MISIHIFKNRNLLTTAMGLVLVALAVARIHLRVQTTLVGYQIGKLKNEETLQLERRSALKMQLAKLTTQKHLQLMSESDSHPAASQGTFAQK